MREILFRGKRLNDGKWVYGSLIQMDEEGSQSFIFPFYKYASSLACDQIVSMFMVVVYPATVGQYTFLNDIDDKKIFTADILQDKITEELYVVDFIGGGFGLFTMKEYLDLKHRHTVILWDGLSEPQTACFVTQNLEVIGNIHDNPELLEEVTK